VQRTATVLNGEEEYRVLSCRRAGSFEQRVMGSQLAKALQLSLTSIVRFIGLVRRGRLGIYLRSARGRWLSSRKFGIRSGLSKIAGVGTSFVLPNRNCWVMRPKGWIFHVAKGPSPGFSVDGHPRRRSECGRERSCRNSLEIASFAKGKHYKEALGRGG